MSSNGAHIDQVSGQLAGCGLIMTVGIWRAVPLSWKEDEREVTSTAVTLMPGARESLQAGHVHTAKHSSSLTHSMDILKHFVHSNQLIVELIISGGVGQECVPIRDEQVEDLHHLRGGTVNITNTLHITYVYVCTLGSCGSQFYSRTLLLFPYTAFMYILTP